MNDINLLPSKYARYRWRKTLSAIAAITTGVVILCGIQVGCKMGADIKSTPSISSRVPTEEHQVAVTTVETPPPVAVSNVDIRVGSERLQVWKEGDHIRFKLWKDDVLEMSRD